MFSCTDTIKEVPVTSNFPVKCLFNPNATADKSFWEVPTEWPVCTFKDAESCDPQTEIAIPPTTGIIPDTNQFILKGSDGVFKCKNTSRVIVPPSGPTSKTFKIKCEDNGKFKVLQAAEWPTCQWPSCKFSTLPPDNQTKSLRPIDTNDTLQNDFKKYQCPGGNVTDNGIYVLVACVANSDGSGAIYTPPDVWPDCRIAINCTGAAFPSPPEASTATGLTCVAADTKEFSSLVCTCPAGKIVDSTIMPLCGRNGVWQAPAIWPRCVEYSTTVATTTATTSAGNSTATGATASGSTGSTVANTATASSLSQTSSGSTTGVTATTSATTAKARRKRDVPDFVFDEDLDMHVPLEEFVSSRHKRQASTSNNYIKVIVEIQFAAKATTTGLKVTNVTDILRNITNENKGFLEADPTSPFYMKIETPPVGKETCRDCLLAESKHTFLYNFLNQKNTSFLKLLPVFLFRA